MPKSQPVLTCINNWESLEYRINGIRVKSLSKVKIDGKTYDVVASAVTVPYSDTGHTYTATSTHYFVKLPVGKKFVEVDMDSLPRGLIIVPVTYTLEKVHVN